MNLFTSVKEEGNGYIIRNFPLTNFSKRLKKEYGTVKLDNLLEAVGINFFKYFSQKNRSVKVHKFFVPELIYLLKKFNYPKKLIKKITENTWVKDLDLPVNDRVDLRNIRNEMNLTLRNFQEDFVKGYDIKKQKYKLNGYLLSFDQGLGKTLTSLALMVALKKETVIIIAPKSTLQTVWEHHIEKFYKGKRKIAVVNIHNINADKEFIILNYEAMNKLDPIINELSRKGDKLGIIVDESHNFLRQKSNRTQVLIKLRSDLNCKDTLLMSGTPIKALGLEVIPILMVLDPFFDEAAIEIYKKAFGLNTTIAADVLKTRMNIMMHRKVKEEVTQLPKKFEETIMIKTPYGSDYAISSVKQKVEVFSKERLEYYKEHKEEHTESFYKIIEYLKDFAIADTPEFKQYLKNIKYLRENVVSMANAEDRELITSTNEFEREKIIPELPNDLKKEFKNVKSAVKYPYLKVRGEVIGGLLSRLRIKMTKDMIEHCELEKLVMKGLKKTVIFTSYVDVIESTEEYLKKKKLNSVLVYGKTANDTKRIVDKFKTDDNINPIIASLNSMSTGVTLTEADTMIFLNKPWRHVDYAQASDRIHRIGQDVDVTIYSLVLDTGKEDNLSTRMEFINNWSKEQFDSIVESSV